MHGEASELMMEARRDSLRKSPFKDGLKVELSGEGVAGSEI